MQTPIHVNYYSFIILYSFMLKIIYLKMHILQQKCRKVITCLIQ